MTSVRTRSSDPIRLKTPAKVNLGLRLVGQRADGYHLIESLFSPIALWDEVTIGLTDGPDETHLSLTAESGAGIPAELSAVGVGPDNLVVRAAESFRQAVDLRGRIDLTLTKSIPAGAGLGGGSSDAAATLTGLSELVGAQGPTGDELAGLALALGADIPFFLCPSAAIVTGIGEQVSLLPNPPKLDLVLANPGISVGTADVYRTADVLSDSLTRAEAGSTMRAFSTLCDGIVDRGVALGELLVNDLQPAAVSLCPPIAVVADQLAEQGATAVGMSGSGATVFGIFESAPEAESAATRLRDAEAGPPWVAVTKTIG